MHTPLLDPSSCWESQVGFTRLLLLLLNSVRLVNNSASTQLTNKQAGSTNGQTGRWKNERQKEKPNGRVIAFAGAPFPQAVLQAVPTSSFPVVKLSSHKEAGKFVQLTLPWSTDSSLVGAPLNDHTTFWLKFRKSFSTLLMLFSTLLMLFSFETLQDRDQQLLGYSWPCMSLHHWLKSF